MVSIASVLTIGNYCGKVKPVCTDRLSNGDSSSLCTEPASLPNVLDDHNAPQSVRILFPRWVRQADAADNGTIEIRTRAEPNPETRQPYAHGTVDAAIAWLIKRRLLVQISRGRGRGHHPKYCVRWSFEHESLRGRQYQRNHEKLQNGQCHIPIEENQNPRLSEDKTTAGGRVHLWQSTQAWTIAIRCKARNIFADVTRKPLQAVLADAAVCHLKREVIAGRLRPRLFDSALEEIAGQLRGSGVLEELEATSPARRAVYRVVGWAVRLWREERLRQAEAWRQSARAHWEFIEAKREAEADPLDFDVVSMIRALGRKNKARR